MAERHNDLDGILAELKASEERRLAAESLARADAAETAAAGVLPAAWARQFVQELSDQCVVLDTQLGPELGRPIPRYDIGRGQAELDVADAQACVHGRVAGVAIDVTVRRPDGLPP